MLDAVILNKRLVEMGKLGLKSIMYAGEGEPFLHKSIIGIINQTKAAGIDVAITTNGVLFGKKIVDSCLENISWVKVSINAGKPDTYSKIHRTNSSDFDKVIKNLEYAQKVKQGKGYSCALGMQLILLPENEKEVVGLAKIARSIGVDYLVVKPYSQHPSSITKRYKDIRYAKYTSLAEKLKGLNTDNFNVVFRIHAMNKWDQAARKYKHCLAIPFWAYIDSDGNVWGCSIFLNDRRFLYGNIYKDPMRDIFNSKSRDRLLDFTANRLNTDECRVNCRMDEINRYLWELNHPPEHVNFI
jgi:radical SAM protein with 4Fe4S-binding SPASM domain